MLSSSSKEPLIGFLSDLDTLISGDLNEMGNSLNGTLSDFEGLFTGGIIDNVIYRGKSAYEIWLDLGHEGTEEDFIKFLASMDSKEVDYNLIHNKPSINDIILTGNRNLPEEEISNLEIEDIFKL